MKQVLSLRAFFGGANTADEAERLTQLGWMAVLLVKGYCYMYQDSSGAWLIFYVIGLSWLFHRLLAAVFSRSYVI